jgi:hypothetical protein
MTDKLIFNGINGATGDYDLPPMTAQDLSKIIAGQEKIDEGLLNELKQRRQAHLGVKEGVDPTDLAKSGWGVIFAAKDERAAAVKDALAELLKRRREQAGDRYHEYIGGEGYRPDESKNQFLSRYHSGPGPVDPDVMPYYLLIVGGPEAIPYRFQYELDVQFAVGRIHFDTLEEYAQYARSVVQAEAGGLALPRQATFFGVRTADDQATMLSADHMVKPLAQKVAEQPGWNVRTLLEGDATKSNLAKLVGGSETPTLLYTASHGMSFPDGDPRQLAHQGALLCQDWPGPGKWKKPILPEFYFSADDVGSEARLLGSMAFFFACYGAGTPKMDEFARQALKGRAEIAPYSFIAKLPRRLLSHPNGGMLAVVGHVERAWGYSFMWDRAGEQLTVFESTLKQLMGGAPLGLSIEYFNNRYAEISTVLTGMIDDLEWPDSAAKVDKLALAGMWTANNDARAYVIIGDPAVRLPLAAEGKPIAERPTISAVKVQAKSQTVAAPATAPPPQAAAAQPEVKYDSVAFALGEQRNGLVESLKDFTGRLAEALSKAADDISSLEVATYTSGDLDGVKYDYNSKKLAGQLRLRALTRIAFDGDAQICVPERDNAIDHDLWQIHLEMVKEAQTNRTQFLAAMAEMATKLVGILKP